MDEIKSINLSTFTHRTKQLFRINCSTVFWFGGMFVNLKKKLNSALQSSLIISESLQQQYMQHDDIANSELATEERSSDIREGDGSTLTLDMPSGVNVTAGCKLLAKYEDDWKAMHDANDANAQKAAFVAQLIETLNRRATEQRIVMMDVIRCLQGIPALVEKLNASLETLAEVRALSATAEAKLDQLQDLCEECELQEFMLQKNYELSQYKKQKMAELESYRQKLAAEHDEKIRRHEERWQKVQRERQAVFDHAFRDDIAEFKEKGAITKFQHKERNGKKDLALEEVVLDDIEPKDALEEFLNG